MAESTKYAFPHEINDNSKVVHFGMTLRDYFAAKAMLGIMTSQELLAGTYEAERFQEERVVDGVCITAYEFADAMLRARETKETTT